MELGLEGVEGGGATDGGDEVSWEGGVGAGCVCGGGGLGG